MERQSPNERAAAKAKADKVARAALQNPSEAFEEWKQKQRKDYKDSTENAQRFHRFNETVALVNRFNDDNVGASMFLAIGPFCGLV